MKAVTPTLAVFSCTSVVAAAAPGSYLRGVIDTNYNDTDNRVCIQNNSTTTTAATKIGTTPAPNPRQVDDEICCQETGAYCIGDDVCLDQYFNGTHTYYCEYPHETSDSGLVTDGYVDTYDDGDAFVELPCEYLNPVDYEICMDYNVTGCQDESNRASKQCYGTYHPDLYICKPMGECNTTTTTTTSTRPAMRQVPSYVCEEKHGNGCTNMDLVCYEHYIHGRHRYYCDDPPEDETTSPPESLCVHDNQECDPDPNESKQCCGTLKCERVDENVAPVRRARFGGIEYACLAVRESESGSEGDYYLSEE